MFLISRIVIFYSISYIEKDKKNIKFLITIILFVLSINFLVTCPNLLISILGWDGLGLISFLLIIFYNNESSNFSGILTIITNRLGDIGLILRIIIIINFFSWNIINYINEKKIIFIVIFFLLLAATTKRAQLPFSAWLPAAIAAPTPVSSLVHSSTLVTAGVYLIIRFYILFRNGIFRETLILTSILTIFFAGVRALFEIDIKKIIALSTLRQLGVIIMILSTKNFELAIFHLLTHALFKSTLFLCAGAIIHSSINWQDIRSISLIFKLRPVISSSLFITNISLIGFPFLRGFYSKDLILEIIYLNNNSFLFIFLIISRTILTSIYRYRLLYYIFKNENLFILRNFHESFFINYPIIFLCILVIFIGNFISWIIFPNPFFFFFNKINKLINLIILFLRIFLFLFFFIRNKKSNFFNFYFSFFGKIWFLDNSSLITTFFLPQSKFIFKNLENWIELFRRKIFLNENIYFFFLLKNFIISNINLIVKISILIIFLFIFI